MAQSITIDKALAYAIKDTRKPLISDYDIGKIIYACYKNKKYQNFNLRVKKDNPTPSEYKRAKDIVLNDKVIKRFAQSQSYPYYKVIGSPELSDQEMVCMIDPFSYISHYSAMQFYGLVNNSSNDIFYTSPSQSLWKQLAIKKMNDELGDDIQHYLDSGLPKLKRSLLPKFKKRTVIKFSTKDIGDSISINYGRLRISTISRTFLDMVRKAEYCGGMKLVISIFKKYAKNHIDEIVNEIDMHGQKIDKVRAGYILVEMCRLRNKVVDGWTKNSQRGGSQKLDAAKPYKPSYSEKWCLSINI